MRARMACWFGVMAISWMSLAHSLVRDQEVIAFLDHRPVFKGHVLVAPTRHIETLLSLPGELMVPLLTMTQRTVSRPRMAK